MVEYIVMSILYFMSKDRYELRHIKINVKCSEVAREYTTGNYMSAIHYMPRGCSCVAIRRFFRILLQPDPNNPNFLFLSYTLHLKTLSYEP